MNGFKINFFEKTWEMDSLVLDFFNEKMHYSLSHEFIRGIILKDGFDEYHLSSDLKTTALEQTLLNEFCQEQKIETPDILTQYLSKTGQTMGELKDKLFFHYRIEALKKLVIDEGQVRETFLQQKASRDQVLFQLIRTQTQAEAQSFYQQIQDGSADFTSLALKHSIGEEAKNGGIVGPIPLRALNQKLTDCLSQLSPGQLSEPLQMDTEVFLIVRLLRYDFSDLTPQLERSIRSDLFDTWIQKKKVLGEAKFELA